MSSINEDEFEVSFRNPMNVFEDGDFKLFMGYYVTNEIDKEYNND